MRRPSPRGLITFVATIACCAVAAAALPGLGRADDADGSHSSVVTVAGHVVTLTILGDDACRATGEPLRLSLTARADGSGGGQFRQAQLYLDRGARVAYHHEVRRHGHLRSVWTVANVANELVRSLPARISMSLHGVPSGPHLVRALVVYTTTTRQGRRVVTQTSSARLSLRFRVC